MKKNKETKSYNNKLAVKLEHLQGGKRDGDSVLNYLLGNKNRRLSKVDAAKLEIYQFIHGLRLKYKQKRDIVEFLKEKKFG